MKPLSPHRGLSLALLGLCATLLTSCSASYKATRVATTQIKTAKPGIYYALPRTELLVVAGIKKTTTKAGIYAGKVWETCEKACKSNPSGACPAAPNGTEMAYELTNLKAYSRAVADTDHIYYVNVDLKAFAAFSHTFKLNSEGILTSSSSEIENKTAEVAISTTKALAKIVTAAMAAPASANIDCADFKPMYDKYAVFKRRVEGLRKSLDDVLFAKPTPTGPAIEQLVKRHEERVRELKASDEFVALTKALQESQEEKDLGSFAVLIRPGAFASAQASANSWQPIQQIDTEGFAGLEVKAAEESEIAAVTAQLNSTNVTVDVAPLIGFTAADNGDTAEPENSTGYRYRFPAAATVTVKRGSTIIGNSRTFVAQYGAITAMPSKIFGVKSKIALDLYESTGAPRQVDVGATPQPSNIVGDALTPVQDELDRRNKAKEEAKKKAETAEFDALTKERDILKLKKEIRELNQAAENENQEGTP